ncbi:hypothetical protein ACE6H2_015176 [Prunus campanulata]
MDCLRRFSSIASEITARSPIRIGRGDEGVGLDDGDLESVLVGGDGVLAEAKE